MSTNLARDMVSLTADGKEDQTVWSQPLPRIHLVLLLIVSGSFRIASLTRETASGLLINALGAKKVVVKTHLQLLEILQRVSRVRLRIPECVHENLHGRNNY